MAWYTSDPEFPTRRPDHEPHATPRWLRLTAPVAQSNPGSSKGKEHAQFEYVMKPVKGPAIVVYSLLAVCDVISESQHITVNDSTVNRYVKKGLVLYGYRITRTAVRARSTEV